MPEAKPVDEEPRFEVAISFAGDNKRDKVRKVAELVREQLGEDTVFFDEFYEHEIPGQDAVSTFKEYFMNKPPWLCRACCLPESHPSLKEKPATVYFPDLNLKSCYKCLV